MEDKILSLVFDANDNVFKLMQKEMLKHNARQYFVRELSGKLKEGMIEYFEKSELKTKKLKNAEIVKGSGVFKRQVEEYLGKLNVVVKGDFGNKVNAVLTQGIAGNGLSMRLKLLD